MSKRTLAKPTMRTYATPDEGRVYGYDGYWGCFVATAGLGLLGGFTLGAIAMVPASGGVSGFAAAKLALSTAAIFATWYRVCVIRR